MLLLSGPPGSGKTTQAEILAQKLGCPHFSIGGLLREGLGKDQIARMSHGELVSDKIVIPMVENALKVVPKTDEVVIDGFLRTVGDVNWLKRLVETGERQLTSIIFLELGDNQIKNRLTKRGRLDDSEQSIKERLEIYHSTKQMVKDELIKNNLQFHEVDGHGSIDEVAAKIWGTLK